MKRKEMNGGNGGNGGRPGIGRARPGIGRARLRMDRAHPRPRHKILRSLLLIAAAVLIAAVFFRFSPYPSLARFKGREVSTKIFDRDGKLIQILALENGVRREKVPLSEIPPFVVQAFIESEDRHFYSHHGIDVTALLRALFQNVSEGRTVSGASTITMQLARLIKPHKNRTIISKLLEAADALRLESRLSKNEILELYLNNLPFGFNCEGVASAARTFFGQDIKNLSVPQAWCLSVIPRRPASYNPLTQSENCAQAAWSLYRETSSSYSIEDFFRCAKSAHSFSYPFEFPHYVRYLKQKETAPVTRCAELVLPASLALQKKAENLLAREIDRYRSKRISNGSVLIIENATGSVLAWAGSADYSDRAHAGEIDGVLTREQPGSSMKPFLYALALENGWSPASVLADIPLEFGFEELYVPQNFNNRYSGPVRFRVALASSLNVPAVSLLNELGLTSYYKKLEELGFESLKDTNVGLSLALGGAEVSLFELVQAFSVFPRDGVFLPVTSGAKGEGAVSVAEAESTTRPDSRTHSPATSTTSPVSSPSPGAPTTRSGAPTTSPAAPTNPNPRRVFDSDTARLICAFLSDETARATGFGYSQVFQTSYPSMFKTGTANQYQNITALAATPRYTVGVWMGNFTGETIIGKTGSSIPAKIARELLDYLSAGATPVTFAEPSRYTITEICPLSGMKKGPHCPSSVFEYTPATDSHRTPAAESSDSSPAASRTSLPFCAWHTEDGVHYPAEYSSWFRLKNRSGSVDSSTSPLTIVSPREGSVFFFDPSSAAKNQNITIEAIGSEEEIASVYLDSTFFATVGRPFVCHIPLSRGEHTVTFSTQTQTASVSFTVK